MSQILKLRTMHCGTPGHDKTYGAAIVRDDSGFHILFTFYGPRGKPQNVRREVVSQSSAGLYTKYDKVIQTRQGHSYIDVDWKDTFYGLISTVRALGTPPGESEPVAPVATVKPKPVARAKKPHQLVDTRGGSFGTRDI